MASVWFICLVTGNCPYITEEYETKLAMENACVRAALAVSPSRWGELSEMCEAGEKAIQVIPVTDYTMNMLAGIRLPDPKMYVAGLFMASEGGMAIFIAAQHKYERGTLIHEYLHFLLEAMLNDHTHCGPWWSEIQTALPEECPKQ